MILLNSRIHSFSLCLFSATMLATPAFAQVINPYPIDAPSSSGPVIEESTLADQVEQMPEPLVEPAQTEERMSPNLSADALNHREWQLLQRITNSGNAETPFTQQSEQSSEPPQEALAAPEPAPVTEHEMQQIKAEEEIARAQAQPPEPVIYNDDQWERKVEQEAEIAQPAEQHEAEFLSPPEENFEQAPPQESFEPAQSQSAFEEAQPAPIQSAAVQSQNWGAQEGENMRDVLGRWSDKAGVAFVWNTRNQFAVLNTVNFATTYEAAVRDLLNQYKEDEVRPYGVLNVEPNTGARTLAIDSGEDASG